MLRIWVVVGWVVVSGCRPSINEPAEGKPGARQSALLDPSQFDAGWRDDGGLLVGCEVTATVQGTPPECSPSTAGCTGSADCASGLCLSLVSGRICTRACASNAGCDPGWTCQLRWTGGGKAGFCIPTAQCQPLQCSPGQCGSLPDGCGGTVTCATCDKNFTCDSNSHQCVESCADCGPCGPRAPCPDGSCPGPDGVCGGGAF